MLLGLFSHYFFGISLFLISVFLILLVLVQRGRGGGIAGALGGAGGQSAFGTKAGDLFTRITVGVAGAWILMCCLAIYFLKGTSFSTGVTQRSSNAGEVSGVGGGTAGTEGNTPDAPSGETPAAEESSTDLPATDPPATDPPATDPPAVGEPAVESGTTPEATTTPATDDATATEPPAGE